MKSYIQGMITGGVMVFVMFVLMGTAGNDKSDNKESAHYYINAILDAEIGRNISVNNQLATANQMSFEILKDSFKNDPRLFPEAQIIERYEDTSIIMDFDYEMMIDEMWDNILDS